MTLLKIIIYVVKTGPGKHRPSPCPAIRTRRVLFRRKPTLIEVKNLTKKYGSNTAVSDLTFTVEDGRIYGLLGPNGAGKTPTMNIMTGCLSATSGSVTVDGYDIFEEAEEAKKRIGYLPEIPPLYTDMTPKEYLTFVAEAKGVPYDRRAAQVKKVMEQTDIAGVANRLIMHLSKGYRQRVGIAQAMLGDPDVIILDEPTVGLDPKQIIEIRNLIRGLAEKHTVIISSHILSEIAEVCDHVLIIAGGKLVADESLADLEERAKRSNGLIVRARCGAAEMEKTVGKAAGCSVKHTSSAPGGLTEAVVSTGDSPNASEAVFSAFASAGIPVSEMYFRESSLESIFLELTEGSIFGDDEDEDEDEKEDEYEGDSEAEEESRAGGKDSSPDDDDDGDGGDAGDDDYKPLFSDSGREEDDR